MSRPWRRPFMAAALLLMLAAVAPPVRAQSHDDIQAQLDGGQLKEALEAATRLTQANPADCRAWRLMGDAQRRLSRIRLAGVSYRKGLEACPDDKELLRTFGFMLDESEQYEEAARVLGQLWALDSSDPLVGSRLGGACYRSGRCAEGRKAYETLLTAHPERTTDRLAFAQLLGRVCKDPVAAEAEFLKLIQEKPDDPNVRCAYIYVLADAGRTADAVRVAEEGLKSGGNGTGCLYAAWGRALEVGADSLMSKARVAPALEMYQQAIAPLTQGAEDKVFGSYCQAILAEVRYKLSPMEELKP